MASRDQPQASVSPDPQPAARRWAGAAVAAVSLVLIAAFVLYVASYGQPGGSGAGGAVTTRDRGAHLLDRWSVVSSIWYVEAAAWAIMAVAGFTLQRRPRPGPGWLPAPVAWTMVGVGASLQTVMYAFMLGGYPAAAAVAAELPALLESLNGAAIFLFSIANAVVFLGQGGVLIAEAGPAGVVPTWLAIGGGAICLLAAALAGAVMVGAVGMMAAGPPALLGTIAMVALGIGIWRHG